MFNGLRSVFYWVDDITKAKEWYQEVLGVEPNFDEPFYVGFTVAGYELGLLPKTEETVYGNNISVAWGVDDVDKVYKFLLSKGAKEKSLPRDVGGGIIVASVLDPFGNIFEIIYNPHFKL